MPLDPQVAALLESMAELGLPAVADQSPPEARATYRQTSAARAGSGPRVEVGSVEDGTVAGVPVRSYRPDGPTAGATVAYFHGGGWVIGDLDTHDRSVRLLCAGLGARVVAVDYPLAPEHPFPAALDAATAVVAALAAEGPVAVAGDSAGGNLAAAVALRGAPVVAQLLLYPVLDAGMDTASYAENAEGFGLTAKDMTWFWRHYDAPAGDPLAAPLRAPDLTGLPPAVVVTAGYDVLRDEGDAYAGRLAAAGVPVTHLRYPTLNHGFFASAPVVDAAGAAADEICAAFRPLLS